MKENTVRNKFGRIIPNWESQFQDFPLIPECKKWKNDNTVEQEIYFKLSNGIKITTREEKLFSYLIEFYQDLFSKLKTFNYKFSNKTELRHFSDYLNYAYNWTSLIYNELKFSGTYRLVVNESVSGVDSSLNNVSFLKYPPLEIVKNIGRYNRANTPNTNIFYSSQNVDTLLKEIKPEIGKLVTVGTWTVKNPKNPFMHFPLPIAPKAYLKNENVRLATDSYKLKEFSHPLLKRHFDIFFDILGTEFTKIVSNHYEYILSSLFAENIFETRTKEGVRHFDLMTYPTVAGDYKYSNMAILPEIVDKRFKLENAFEFRVTKSFYNLEIPSNNYNNQINLAEIADLKYVNKIVNQSELVW